MKKITLLFTAIIFSVNVYSQNWLWARGATGVGSQEGYCVATDAHGNVFVTGYSNLPITFDTITVTGGFFLVKYDGTGNVLWAVSAVNGNGFSVTTDLSGNVFVTGQFGPSITFGTTTLTFTPGGADVFLVKYDGAGNVLWAKGAGGAGLDRGCSVSTDALGNVFITGFFYSPTITFGTTTLTNSSIVNFFIAKYDEAGNVLWAQSAGGSNPSQGSGIATDVSGNVIATGFFSSPTIVFGTTTLTNAGNYDVFLVKYDGTGNVLWAKEAGGVSGDFGLSVATDAAENVFVTGRFSPPTITFGTTTLSNAGGYDMFLAKYDSIGNLLWVKGAGGAGADIGYSIATDSSGNAYVAGGTFPYAPSITFGSYTLYYPPVNSLDPMFLVKYGPSGILLCASVLASGGDDENAVATDRFGNVFIGGDFYYTNPFIVGADSLPLTGGENIFVAKYNCGSMENIYEFSNERKVNIFPNPATASFTIYPEYSGRFTISEIEIYNTVGERILSQQLKANSQQQITINVSHFHSGIYFITVTDEAGNKVTKKVVKM